MAQVVSLGSDALKRQSPEKQKQFFQRALAPAVAFAVAEKNVELAVVAGLQVKLVVRKNFQPADANLGGQQIGQPQDTGGRESHGTIEQSSIELRRGLASHFHDLRLAHTVPILQRSFIVPLQKIDGAEKIIPVSIAGIKMQRSPQVARGDWISLLLECHSRQFQRKSFVARQEQGSGGKRSPSLVPMSQVGECRAVVEIEFSGRILCQIGR